MNKVLNYYKVRDYNLFTKEEIERLEELNTLDDNESPYIEDAFLSLLTSIRNNNYRFDFLQFLRNDYYMLYCSKRRITELRRYLKRQSRDEDTTRLLTLLKKLSKNFDYKYLLPINITEEIWLYNHYPNIISEIFSREDEHIIQGTNSVGYQITTFCILKEYDLIYLLNRIEYEITYLTNHHLSIPTTLIRLYNKILKVYNRVSRL